MSSFSVSILKKRSSLLRYLRSFFYDRQVLEVDVPVLGKHTVTDVFIEPLSTAVSGREYFLQTSPEYYMKRLLADGVESIFYLGKAFRQDEHSKRHRPEFTMLEWYRLGLNDHALMLEVEALLLGLVPNTPIKKQTYGDLFESILGCCPHVATIGQLHALALSHTSFEGELETKSAYLDLLFSFCVEPAMTEGIVFVCDYPESQAALARVTPNEHGVLIARRFEVFWNGLELANGYWELIDAQEQRKRFDADLLTRKGMGLNLPELDEHFLEALDKGLPECAGVALGVDRLLMCMQGSADIAEVMLFPND